VDIVHDLNEFPYPFKDDFADYIYMLHVLEHLENPYKVLVECHRILKNEGVLDIIVPHKNNLSAYDIAHRSYFTEWSLGHLSSKKGDSYSLQKKPLFQEIFRKVKRVIPTPWGYIPGFKIYGTLGVGIRSEIRWKLKKMGSEK